MNNLELEVASYLDEQEHLFFWYRNPVRKGYHVQGWKRSKIFADFILTLARENGDASRPRTTTCSWWRQRGCTSSATPILTTSDPSSKSAPSTPKGRGGMQMVPAMRDKRMRFEVVDQEEWQARLNELLADCG